MKQAIVIDIDGVILDTSFILKEAEKLGLKGNAKWRYFYENCNSDRVHLMLNIKRFLNIFLEDAFLIISTGRNWKCSVETDKKLLSYGIEADRMFMRKDDDLRPAHEVKYEHLKTIMKEFQILAFIDDEIENCEMAKELGILALRRV